MVKVTLTDDGRVEITLYPNPVSRSRQGGKASLQLRGLAGGLYSLSVYSHGGQRVYQRKVTVGVASASQSEEIRLGSGLAQGSYEVRLADSKGRVVYSRQILLTE